MKVGNGVEQSGTEIYATEVSRNWLPYGTWREVTTLVLNNDK